MGKRYLSEKCFFSTHSCLLAASLSQKYEYFIISAAYAGASTVIRKGYEKLCWADVTIEINKPRVWNKDEVAVKLTRLL